MLQDQAAVLALAPVDQRGELVRVLAHELNELAHVDHQRDDPQETLLGRTIVDRRRDGHHPSARRLAAVDGRDVRFGDVFVGVFRSPRLRFVVRQTREIGPPGVVAADDRLGGLAGDLNSPGVVEEPAGGFRDGVSDDAIAEDPLKLGPVGVVLAKLPAQRLQLLGRQRRVAQLFEQGDQFRARAGRLGHRLAQRARTGHGANRTNPPIQLVPGQLGQVVGMGLIGF